MRAASPINIALLLSLSFYYTQIPLRMALEGPVYYYPVDGKMVEYVDPPRGHCFHGRRGGAGLVKADAPLRTLPTSLSVCVRS